VDGKSAFKLVLFCGEKDEDKTKEVFKEQQPTVSLFELDDNLGLAAPYHSFTYDSGFDFLRSPSWIQLPSSLAFLVTLAVS
jgi:GT2 family glycosyltransferase